jgi:FemAB-related protein (PEP-CTERM system-associated)
VPAEASSVRTASGEQTHEPAAELAGVTVRRCDADDSAAWDAFVRRQPQATFFHLAAWQDVLRKAFGHRTYYLLAERRGVIVGVLPLAHVRSRLFGNALISTPFCVYGGVLADGELPHKALTARACELARSLRVDYLEMRNRRRTHVDWPAKELYVTFRKAIAADAETNMLAIPRKQRAMVRKGIQNNLQAVVDPGIERLYALYSESLRNLGTPVFSRHYLRVLREAFADASEVVTITHEGAPIASVLSFFFRDEVLPYYGGGSLAARALAGNDYMYWAVMERARERGMRLFDYGRSKRDTGSFDFKANWGFEPETLSYEYFLVNANEVPNLSPTNPRFERLIRLWRRLPLRMTQWLGPPLAKYLG